MDLLRCPSCRGKLERPSEHALACRVCVRSFPVEEGIPLLYSSNDWESGKPDVTDSVRAFYEENPFPNYDDVDSVFRLAQKAEQGFFARMLNEQIPPGSRVLEVGCGTGQLSNYLGSMGGNRRVFGTDLCLNSLKLAERFRRQNEIENLVFLQMNLFRPTLPPNSFDVVICSGVLHHTSDPERGFHSIVGLVREGGILIIGLYNALGRVPNDLRMLLFKIFGKRLLGLDRHLRNPNLGEEKRRVWFKDQYEHPHESRHTMDEVLQWFKKANVQFVNALPAPVLFQPFSPDSRLFEPHSAGNRFERFLVQLNLLLQGGREGGYFIMIGRRR